MPFCFPLFIFIVKFNDYNDDVVVNETIFHVRVHEIHKE